MWKAFPRRLLAFSRPASLLVSRSLVFPRRQLWTQPRLQQKNVKDAAAAATKKVARLDQPQLMIAFTCKKCNTRSSHTMSKQAYHHGTVLIQCPGCHNRHLIADHLKIFHDNHITIEEIMKSQGETVSQTTKDLVFEDIPPSLQKLIGHHAKDAPRSLKDKLDNKSVHTLPK